jgi:hypothetical protein
MTEARKIQGQTAAAAIRSFWTLEQGRVFSTRPVEAIQQVEITQKEEPHYEVTTAT